MIQKVKSNNKSNSFFTILKWIFSVMFLFAGLMAFAEHHLLAGIGFLVAAIVLLPPLQKMLKAKFSFFNNVVVGIIVLVGLIIAGSDLPKPVEKPKSAEQQKEVVKETNKEDAKPQAPINTDTTPIQQSNTEKASKIIEGINPVDIYGNFEKKGFKVDKQITNDGSFFICTLDDKGINYEVKTYCEKGVNDVTMIRLMATRSLPQYNNVNSMKPFLLFGSTIPYDGADADKARDFINQNYSKDKASIVIGGVKFTIYCKTEFTRMLDIEKE